MSLKILVVEDDAISCSVMMDYLAEVGECECVADGINALAAYIRAAASGEPYHLICLDIMMPEMNGHEVLKEIRRREEEAGIPMRNAVKVIMTSALDDNRNVLDAFNEQCEAYLIKPIKRDRLFQVLRELNLIG